MQNVELNQSIKSFAEFALDYGAVNANSQFDCSILCVSDESTSGSATRSELTGADTFGARPCNR